MSVCAPGKENNTHTCFSDKSLITIIQSYNKKYPHDKIMYSKAKFNREKAWNDIQKKLLRWTSGCDKDYCLLKTPLGDDINDEEIHDKTFRPETPHSWKANPTDWLSTLDIVNVINQYSEKYRDFHFIGPVPIDFDHKIADVMCVSDELCKINLKRLYTNGTRRLGVVFNLDPHYADGSHWVSMFLNANTGGIYFFDSAGASPPPQVRILMNRLKDQGNKMILDKTIKLKTLDNIHKNVFTFKKVSNKRIKVINGKNIKNLYKNVICFTKGKLIVSMNYVKSIDGDIITLENKIECEGCSTFMSKCFKNFFNKKQLQFKNTECGIFAINFTEEMLSGKRFDEIIADPYKNDLFMIKKRKEYYRPNISHT